MNGFKVNNDKVDIVVPVYNERENFQTLYDFISKNVKSDWRMLVVYDFPEDSTLESAKPISQKDSKVILIQNRSRGALEAIKSGIAKTANEAIMVLMSDEDPEMLKKIDEMTDTFYKENADIVAAARYMKGGARKGGSWLKGSLSKAACLSLYYLIRLPTHDATNNTKLYRKSFLEGITIESKRGFELALEITVKAHLLHKKIIEIPTIWTERTQGKSKFQLLRWLPSYLYWYFYAIWGSIARRKIKSTRA